MNVALISMIIAFTILLVFFMNYVISKIRNLDNKIFKFFVLISEWQEKFDEKQKLEETLDKSNEYHNTSSVPQEEHIEEAEIKEVLDISEKQRILECTPELLEYKDMPIVNVEDIRNKIYENISVKEVALLPYIDADGMPGGKLLPKEVIYCIRRYYQLVDYSRLIDGDVLKNFLKDNNITISSYNYSEMAQDMMSINTGLGIAYNYDKVNDRKSEYKEPDIASNVLKVMKYIGENDKIVQVTTESMEVYKSYLHKFDSEGIPKGEKFIEWFDEMADGILRLVEVK